MWIRKLLPWLPEWRERGDAWAPAWSKTCDARGIVCVCGGGGGQGKWETLTLRRLILPRGLGSLAEAHDGKKSSASHYHGLEGFEGEGGSLPSTLLMGRLGVP